MVDAAPATAGEALEKIHRLLRDACDGASPPRPAAVRYSHCRSVLLSGPSRGAIPGFLTQCVTLDRFREFIGLLDPRVETRTAFIDAAFVRSRAMIGSSRIVDIFASDP